MATPIAIPWRRPLARFAAIALAAALLATPSQAQKRDDGFQTAAPHAILIDGDGGSVLYEKSADEPIYPASMSKLMTMEVVFNELKEGNIKLTDEFLISEDAWRRGGAPSRGSTMFAAINSRVKVADLIRGAIIVSGNDSCIALAQGIAGNESQFGRLMTGRAYELGMTKSNFTNATGLHDPDHQTTVRDLATLARHIIRTYPDFYPIFSEREFTWNKIRQFNRNPLLNMNIDADGLKTGFTKESGYGVVGSAKRNGLRVIGVVAGLKSDKERADEGRRLLDWGLRTFESRLLFAEGQYVGEAKVFGGAKGEVPLIGKREIRVMIPKGSTERLVARVIYMGPLRAPVQKGRPTGTLKVFRGKQLALEVPLEAAENIGVGTTSQRAVDAAMELVISLFRAGIAKL